VLHYVLDLAVAEIAVIVQAPEGTVKSDLSRARDRLRARLVGDES
jgi:DNA-directed RNA polymerase specialized sigma24 family protein